MKTHWEQLTSLTAKYSDLKLDESIDYQKFVLYSLVHHSTAIEGGTLTEGETEVLLEKGLTAAGKPLEHSLMVRDCFEALNFLSQKSEKKTKLTSEFLKLVAGMVMKGTGSAVNCSLGSFDTTKGEYRLTASFAQGGGYYLNPSKIPNAVGLLCNEVNKRMDSISTIEDKYKLSFDTQFNLVSIHPWGDGNGRTCRLMMNYIQLYYKLPLTKVYLSDRLEYIEALKDTRKKEDIEIFRNFMCNQQIKFLSEKINEFKKDQRKEKIKGINFLF